MTLQQFFSGQRRSVAGSARVFAASLLVLVVLASGGCAFLGVLADGFAGERTVTFDARYDELEDKSVAVLVAADQRLLYEHPASQELITAMLSSDINNNVEDVRVVPPRQIMDYKDANSYWMSWPLSPLFEEFDVDRLVVVELGRYQTYEQGNRHVMQGVIAGRVEVYEREATDPDNPDFVEDVRAEFPETGMSLGVVGEDPQAIEQGAARLFSRNAARLFHEYEEVVKR